MAYRDRAVSLTQGLPRTDVFQFDVQPEAVEEIVEFRLIYKGRLPAQKSGSGGGRREEKHRIRKEFHKQLKGLWTQHPDLRSQSERRYLVVMTPANQVSEPGPNERVVIPGHGNPNAKTWLETIADNHQRCGGRFVPLISKDGGFTCSLDILFLRRDNPGNLIASGGDIDNRIKVLLDGLKMPETVADLGGFSLESDENPFFCLLEDDNLITDITITTDRLLLPQDTGENIHDVFLIIHVTMLNPSAVFAGNRLV